MSNTNVNTTMSNWVFIPVHKSRLLKELDKAFLIKVDNNSSTILPKVFKRLKETPTHMFFSVPSDFNINVRYSTYDMKTKRYGSRDVCKPIGKEEMQKLIKRLGYELASKQEEEKALEDSPF